MYLYALDPAHDDDKVIWVRLLSTFFAVQPDGTPPVPLGSAQRMKASIELIDYFKETGPGDGENVATELLHKVERLVTPAAHKLLKEMFDVMVKHAHPAMAPAYDKTQKWFDDQKELSPQELKAREPEDADAGDGAADSAE